jgi:hypothetical protein
MINPRLDYGCDGTGHIYVILNTCAIEFVE